MPRWWDTLVGRSNTPLNEVADPETIEEVLDLLRRIDQRHQRENADLRFEWSEMLDKMTRLANRASARQRKRTQRELDDLDSEEVEPPPPPPQPIAPAPGGYDFRDKNSIRAYLAARNGGRR